MKFKPYRRALDNNHVVIFFVSLQYGRTHLGPVVRRPISANLGLNFDPGFFFFCSKAFSPIIFSIIFRASNYQTVDKTN